MQADYFLKELALGEYTMPVVGMLSVFDWSEADQIGAKGSHGGFWLLDLAWLRVSIPALDSSQRALRQLGVKGSKAQKPNQKEIECGKRKNQNQCLC